MNVITHLMSKTNRELICLELWDVLDVNGNKTGRTVERGQLIKKGDYHLVVFVWIRNSNGMFLISRRSPLKSSANKWETVGGAAVKGEDSLRAALREVYEEIGITLNLNNALWIDRYINEPDYTCIEDIWLFNEDVDISKVVCQSEEVSEVKWATKKEIFNIIEEGNFFNSFTHKQVLPKIT